MILMQAEHVHWQNRPGVPYVCFQARKGKRASYLPRARDKSRRAGLVRVLHLNFTFKEHVQVFNGFVFSSEDRSRIHANVIHAFSEPCQIFVG